MISVVVTLAGRLPRNYLVLALAALMAVLGVPGIRQLSDGGPRPFDPDRYIRKVAESPGTGSGLPDLESVAPGPLPVATITFANTEMLVVTFNGLIRNLGPGPLDIFGDPNAADPADGPHQRIWDGDNWTSVTRPPIRFESADGHNHFHFLEIARYSLWDSTMTSLVAPSNKVGFCLIDSVQDDPNANRGYFSDDGNYCRQGSPGATALRMGISPGFSDLYSSDVALQWVDLSDVAPGVYRVAAETDPFGLVEEADETNNGIAFAATDTVVPGHIARPTVLTAQASTAATRILLESDSYGAVGGLRFRITTMPEHGFIESVDKPDGSAIGPLITYTPDPGFVGVDMFRYVAYDPESPYPITPVESVGLITVGVGAGPAIAITGRRAAVHTSGLLRLEAVHTDPGALRTATWAVDGIEGGSPRLGMIDPDGTYHAPDEPVGKVVISTTSDSLTASVEVEVITPPNQRPFIEAPIEYLPLTNPADSQEKLPITAISKGDQAGFIVPATDPNGDRLRFGAVGLPPGLAIDEWSGFVSGKPTTKGIFDVNFSADDGTTTSSITTTITVN